MHEWEMSIMYKCNISNAVHDYNKWIIKKCNEVIVDKYNTCMKNASIQNRKIIVHESKKKKQDV